MIEERADFSDGLYGNPRIRLGRDTSRNRRNGEGNGFHFHKGQFKRNPFSRLPRHYSLFLTRYIRRRKKQRRWNGRFMREREIYTGVIDFSLAGNK